MRCGVQGSASLKKRKREDAEETAAHKAAVAARRERRRRGHARVLPRGKDAERDAVEKALARTATKCEPTSLVISPHAPPHSPDALAGADCAPEGSSQQMDFGDGVPGGACAT